MGIAVGERVASGSATSPPSTTCRSTVRTARYRPARAERQRQVDPAARRSPGSRRPTRARIVHRRTRTPPACRAQAGHRLRVPALRAVQAHDRARQRGLRAEHPQAPQGGDRRARGRAARAGPPRAASPTATRPSSRAVSASAWRSPARSPWSPRSCCSTSRSAPSTPRVRKELRAWLRRLHDETHVTTVFVTHDQEEAMEVAEQIVVMNHGGVEQVGSPRDLYEQPANDFVMQLHRPRHPLGEQLGPAARPGHPARVRAGAPRRRMSTGWLHLGFEVRVELAARGESTWVQPPQQGRGARAQRGPDRVDPPGRGSISLRSRSRLLTWRLRRDQASGCSVSRRMRCRHPVRRHVGQRQLVHHRSAGSPAPPPIRSAAAPPRPGSPRSRATRRARWRAGPPPRGSPRRP